MKTVGIGIVSDKHDPTRQERYLPKMSREVPFVMLMYSNKTSKLFVRQQCVATPFFHNMANPRTHTGICDGKFILGRRGMGM